MIFQIVKTSVDLAGKSGALSVFFTANLNIQGILFDRKDVGVSVNQNWK
jgi:hypothetical protein